jgi:hypothetical protein
MTSRGTKMGTRINAGTRQPHYTLGGKNGRPHGRRFGIMIAVEGDRTVTARRIEKAVHTTGLFHCKGLDRIKIVTREYK